MRAGQLKHRVEILSTTPGAVRNQYFDDVVAWGVLTTVWADVRDITGREFFAVQQVHAEVTTRIVIRHRRDVFADMRVRCGTRLWDIKAVLDDGQRQKLELLCAEIIE